MWIDDKTHSTTSTLIIQDETNKPNYVIRPVRLPYQLPANSIFLSQQTATSNQPAVLFSQNKPAPAISHQPTEQADY
jgi:hypothetical protein